MVVHHPKCPQPHAHIHIHGTAKQSAALRRIWRGLNAASASAPQLVRNFGTLNFELETCCIEVYQEYRTRTHTHIYICSKCMKVGQWQKLCMSVHCHYICTCVRVCVCVLAAYIYLLICRHSKVCYSQEIQINPQRSK